MTAPPEPLTLRRQPDAADYAEMMLLRCPALLRRRALPFTLLAALLAAEGLAFREPVLIAAAVLVVGYGWWAVLGLAAAGRRYFTRSPLLRLDCDVHLSAAGMEDRGQEGTTSIGWSAVSHVLETPRCYVVRLRGVSHSRSVVLAKRAATGPPEATLRSWLAPYLGTKPTPTATAGSSQATPAEAPPAEVAEAPVVGADPEPGVLVPRWQPQGQDAADAFVVLSRVTRYRLKRAVPVAGVLLLSLVAFQLGWVLLAYALLVGALAGFGSLLSVPALVRRGFRRSPAMRAPVEARMSAAGIDYRQGGTTAVLPWSRVARVFEGERTYALRITGVDRDRMFLPIPKRASADPAALRALLAPHLADQAHERQPQP